MIQRIPGYYVSDECVQITFSFYSNISLFDENVRKNGVLCHYNLNDDSQNINKYLLDVRKSVFPYSNIPMYKGLFGKYYVNVLFEYNKHYLGIIDGSIRDFYVVKDNDSALLMERKLTIPIFVNGDILAKDGIIKILNSYSKNIIFDKNGRIYYFGNKHFNDFDNFIDCGGGLVFDKGEERTSVRVIKIKKDIGLDDYIYKEYDISLNYYTKEELKYFSSKIKYINDVCVNPLFNPNINKKEINENRKLIRSLRNK